VIILKGRY